MPGRVCCRSLARQSGAAFLLLVVTLVIGAAAVFYGISRPVVSDVEKDKVTAAALEKAKAALIGYAAGVTNFAAPNLQRPGDLPCPDLDDSGNAPNPNPPPVTATTTCNTQASRIGRLPWRTLGLPDLRDGDGERLWYAVSTNFKDSPRTACAAVGTATTCLNSDSVGTITVRNSAGTVIHNGANNIVTAPGGVIAVVFSPGAVLRRQGAGAAQNRTCTGGSCNAQGVCTTLPATNTPKCNPVNYLDTVTAVEDNANFTDSNATNGFINGIVRDATNNIIVNDKLITIRHDELIPLLEKRVAGEMTNCLTTYANANSGRYPWAAPVTDLTVPYGDAINNLFGRVPDPPLSNTLLGIIPIGGALGTALAPLCTLALCMSNTWPATCTHTQGTWWSNWRLYVFYGVADAYKPRVTGTLLPLVLSGRTPTTGCPTCLTVDPPSPAADKQIVVMVAGKRLAAVAGGQLRNSNATRQNPANFLEGSNTTHPTFTRQPSSTTFNDTVIYK